MPNLRIDEPRRVPWHSLPDLIAAAAERGDVVAVADDAGGATFADLAVTMDRVARAAIAAGVGPGDRVVLWAPNSTRWIEAAVGVLAAGAVVVPLSTRLKGAEAAYAIDQSAPSLILTVSDYLGVSFPALLWDAASEWADTPTVLLDDGSLEGTIKWEAFLAGVEDVAPVEVAARSGALEQEHPAFIIFTSGTTGRPKGAILHHKAILHSAVQMCDAFGLVETDRTLVVLPMFHVFGLAMAFASVVCGGALITTSAAFNPDRFVSVLERERITVVPGPPTLFDGFLASRRRRTADLSALRVAFIASTGIPGSLVRKLHAGGLFDHVVSGYGSTEGLIVSLSRLDEDTDTTAGWSGQVLPEARVRVVDRVGGDVFAGEPGELLVRTPSTTVGYFKDPDATASAIDADGWLHTGDVGIVDARGYVRITDRLKDMFISGGFNAYPAEIEVLLGEHPAIAQVAVIGVPDQRLGEVGAAFVVLADGAELSADELVAWAKDQMTNYKVPRVIRFVDALPMTASLKVAKFVLRQQLVSSS